MNKIEINKGFSLIEVIISVTLASIFFSAIFFCFSSVIKIEIVTKKTIYEKFDEINTISEENYIKNSYE